VQWAPAPLKTEAVGEDVENDLLMLPGVKQGIWKALRMGAKTQSKNKNKKRSILLQLGRQKI